jgi:NosR/NirI family nitrous oxide reductase transcriptional regulator
MFPPLGGLAGALIVLAALLAAAPAVLATAYEARLPEGLATDPDLCALVACTEVFPGARSFSTRKGRPPYVEAYGDDKRLLGYVMLSTDITDLPAYSGLPVVTLIGMNLEGRFVGIKVLKHSEPILLVGIPEEALVRFHDQYRGKSVKDAIEVGRAVRGDTDVVYVDAISGATVTVIAQNQVITASGQAVARQVGILPPEQRAPARFAVRGERPDWAQLVKEGAVERLRVLPAQVGLPHAGEPFIELWFGSLDHPDIGRSLLGDTVWEGLRARLKEGEHAIFVIRTAGRESFKGSGFARGGIYDRVQVRQGRDMFTFRDLDYLNLYGLHAAGSPEYTESAIFVIRSPAFSPAYPWKLGFLGNRVDRATGLRSFASFESRYWLAAERLEGGRPRVHEAEAVWKRIWRARQVELVAFVLLLAGTAVVYANRDRLTRRSTFTSKWPLNIFKYTAWAASVFFVGFHLMAQPSVTQVLTWFHALLFQWTWELFLSDPFIFLFWIFIIVTTFVWGRGLFCGWLCPFGSLQEGLYKIARAARLARLQFRLPQPLHDRLKWVKYAVFFLLFGVSLFSMTTAEILAEVEPFKTTFLVGVGNRAWPYGLFVAALLGLSILVERPFCKYLCPLGAALAMPSTFRWFGLPRKAECVSCTACARGCGSQAIDARGRIDHRECLHCLDCLVLYTDPRGCPPLGQERKRREKAGLPLTPIGRDGYFIPIEPVPRAAPAPADDPGHATEPVAPPHLARERSAAWLLAEARHHLFPWSAEGWHSQRAIQIAGVGLAVAATLAWVWAWQGRLGAGAIIGWWIGWSVYEVLMRMHGLAFVKEGPWWRTQYRKANWMDMVSYVGFKNLLIGAALFIGLQLLGRLVV